MPHTFASLTDGWKWLTHSRQARMWLERAPPVLPVPQVVGSAPQVPSMGGWELGGIVSTKRAEGLVVSREQANPVLISDDCSPPTPSSFPPGSELGRMPPGEYCQGWVLQQFREWGQTSQTLHPLHRTWLWQTRQVQARQVQPSRRKHHPSHSLLERAYLPAPKLVARIWKGVFCGQGGAAQG